MSIIIITLLVLSVIPIVLSGVSGGFRHYQLGGVDHSQPREQNQLLEGAGSRAIAAQKNAWEALLVFVAAVGALVLADYDMASLSLYFYALIACRVLHSIFYISDLASLRSLAFLGGYGICIYFFILAI